MTIRTIWFAVIFLACLSQVAWPQELLSGFQKGMYFDEQVRWNRLDSGVRVLIIAPLHLNSERRRLVIFATPNGNTMEQTLGCIASKELDWRFDIQHVAAQIRRFREIDTSQDIVLAVVQAPKLSWPTFRREQAGAGTIIRELVHSLSAEVAADRVTLACHSGGGSFLFGYLNAVDALPTKIDRILFLDANYSYSDDERHGEKLLAWLQGGAGRHLVVIAYDDREITLNGKKVVGPDGGTFRASQRMLTRFRRELELAERDIGPFRHTSGLLGQLQFFIHPNPTNAILHTALVGEMNGLLHGMAIGTDRADQWGKFGGPRAYMQWIQPKPFVDPLSVRASIPIDAPETRLSLPERLANAPTGSQFRDRIAGSPRERREAAILHEIMSGNVPESLRRLIPIRVEAADAKGTKLTATYFVTRDYLAVGTDEDSFRLPMNPRTALAIADAAQCSLITTKVSDDLFAAATLRLTPQPLTKDRDTVATFFEHHQLIEEQLRRLPHRNPLPQGEGTKGLIVGIKKDVVLTNRLREKPHKVAIFGWHYPDGRPIQSLYVGHVDWYVDYSHGIRLMANHVLVDGSPQLVSDVLQSDRWHTLLSNEGPLNAAELRNAANW